ncbi:hypothetical protein WK78_26535 [Burkholderia cepacia]|nr:hypothetical protein WK78_26535 [Burkholderia cepacia]
MVNAGEVRIGNNDQPFSWGLAQNATTNQGMIALGNSAFYKGIYIAGGGTQMTLSPTSVDASGNVSGATLYLNQGSGTTLIKGVSTPVDGTDAANKNYVDSAVSSASNPLAVSYADSSKTAVNVSGAQVKNVASATLDTDAATWGQAKTYADSAVSTLNTSLRGYTDSVASNTLSSAQSFASTQANMALSSANTYTNNAIAGLSIPSGGITQAQLDAAVSSAISTSQNYTNTAISGLAPGGAPQSYVDAKDASTLSSANGYTDQKKAEAVSESKTYTDTKATQTLKSANDYSDQVGSNTLTAANQFTTSEISKLNLNGASEQYVNNAVAQGVAQANSYTDQKFDQAKKYSYSAAAIGMASSSLVFNPNLARQVAIGASTVNGQQAVAIGVAVNLGRMSQVNVKGAYASGMGGASVGYTMGF